MAVLNFFPVQKLIFGHFEIAKKWNLVKNIFLEIDLFDFTSFFVLDFLKFSGPLWYIMGKMSGSCHIWNCFCPYGDNRWQEEGADFWNATASIFGLHNTIQQKICYFWMKKSLRETAFCQFLKNDTRFFCQHLKNLCRVVFVQKLAKPDIFWGFCLRSCSAIIINQWTFLTFLSGQAQGIIIHEKTNECHRDCRLNVNQWTDDDFLKASHHFYLTEFQRHVAVKLASLIATTTKSKYSKINCIFETHSKVVGN